MFEKEAEEYIKEHTFFDEEYGVQSLDVVSKTIFQDGAEFGYNNANEWHYVKDGDLPKKTDEYLVYIINGYGCKSIKLIQYNSGRRFWWVDCQNEVIAWKEIVLPKESE